MGAVLAVTDGEIRRRISSSHPKMAGKKSGEVRAANGQKKRFLDWAQATNAANPSLSKNDVAERYAKDHPGTSAATLRRYLSDIPTVYRTRGED
jgi:hypothetical protein